MKSVTIGDHTFKTKKSAKQYIRDIAARMRLGDLANDEDFRFLLALVNRHPYAPDKIKCGVSAFRKVAAPYGQAGFEIIRTDGTSTDFSWHKCIDNHKDRFIDNFREACRVAIKPQIAEFKCAQRLSDGAWRSELSGEMESVSSKVHVDHASPLTFVALVDDFMRDMAIGDSDWHLLTESADNQYFTEFKDKYMQAKWEEYHLGNARLRIVTATENLGVCKKWR